MLEVNILNADAVQQALRNLADNQMPYAMQVAINNTAFAVRKYEAERLPQVFDNPTPLVKGAMRVKKATKQDLTAIVHADERRDYLLSVHELGMAKRPLHTLEKVLKKMGLLPSGVRAIPSRPLLEKYSDKYGNISRAKVRSLSRAIEGMQGKKSVAVSTKRRYFVIPWGEHNRLASGLWESVRTSMKKPATVMPMLIFVSKTQYKEQLKFAETAQAKALELLPEEAIKAVQRAIETAS